MNTVHLSKKNVAAEVQYKRNNSTIEKFQYQFPKFKGLESPVDVFKKSFKTNFGNVYDRVISK